MAIVNQLPSAADGRRRLRLDSPVDQRSLGELDVSTKEDVDDAVLRARAAQTAWAARPIKERAAIVRSAVQQVVSRREEIIETLQSETGKPRAEALTIEIVPACDFLNHWSSRAHRVLRDERRSAHGYIRPLKKLRIHYQPLGVVGVITPWNAPFILSLNPIAQALLAGNAVVLKPSEMTPRSAEWAVRILHAAGVPEDLVQVLHGDGETGAALVEADVDKISFTGSVGTGRKIASRAGERLVPCTLELGGKDAMIVCADADLERAANGAVYLSMFNTGQVCLSVERIYVADEVAEEFTRLVREKAAAITYGSGDTDMGPLFSDTQLDIVDKHVRDAEEKGATIAVGGKRGSEKGLYFQPTVVLDATPDMAIMREETFGPVVAITRVRDDDEAIRRANDSDFGLGGSVFTRTAQKAADIAKRLKTGSVVHNDAAVIYGVAEAPFGGRKNSGVGQVNGLDSLRGFTHPQPVLLSRWRLQKENVWYPYTAAVARNLDAVVRYGFGNRIMRWFMS